MKFGTSVYWERMAQCEAWGSMGSGEWMHSDLCKSTKLYQASDFRDFHCILGILLIKMYHRPIRTVYFALTPVSTCIVGILLRVRQGQQGLA